jgi:tetrahydromethanopterin S-methyltransferase subunit G
MYDKLNEIEKRYEELQRKIENPSIVTTWPRIATR